MVSSPDSSEIAAAALASASSFLASLRSFSSRGFDAIDAAIGQIAVLPDDGDASDEVRSTAIAGLTVVLGHVEPDPRA